MSSNKNGIPMSAYITSGYLHSFFEPDKMIKTITDLRQTIAASGVKFDAIACRGMSGLLVSSPLGMMMEKPVIVVRKGTSGTHSGSNVEGYLPVHLKYIIVDDFVETGATIRTIIRRIGEYYRPDFFRKTAKCVGVFLYKTYDPDDYYRYQGYLKKNVHGPIQGLSQFQGLSH